MKRLKYLLLFMCCYFLLTFFYSVLGSKGEVIPIIQLIYAGIFGYLSFVIHQKMNIASD
ncbi:hypothetical protein J2S19_004024 [Metabacillus malikii]|uniref:Uncharacterized protein n=1 Tax=Metabacillus malikii TaxID=1504265 RepID=A0ABT9ZLM8_9BACI|nr:hypothetical protein [Metabacillus malikii]